MKKCSKCKIEKELSEFNKHKSKKDGLTCRCKACAIIESKQWYENNKERKKDATKQWCENNKERVKEAKKEWYENNKERAKDANRAYARTTEGKYSQLKNSAEGRDLEMQVSFEQYAELIKDNKCYYCDTTLAGTTGHSLNRIDSSKGYIPENVKPCCGTCNKIMNNFTKEELRTRVYKIIKRME